MLNNNILKKNSKNEKGFSAIVIIIILAVLSAVGFSVYFLTSKPPAAPKTETETKTETKTGSSLEDIKIIAPEMDVSLSPMPKLEVSSLNVSTPELPSFGMFSGISINSDLSYSPSFGISTPAVQFSMPSVPVNPPQADNPTQALPQIDCSLFTSIPSCSYAGAPGSSAYDACKSCYPSK